MRCVQNLESIEGQIKLTPASVSRNKFAECITVAVVPYEIQNLHIGLAVKAMSESSIGNVSGSHSNTVASCRHTRRDLAVDGTIGKRRNSCRCGASGLRVVGSLEIGSTSWRVIGRAVGTNCTRLGRVELFCAHSYVRFCYSFYG